MNTAETGTRTRDGAFLDARDAARASAEAVFGQLGSSAAGLSESEAGKRRITFGANAVRTHQVNPLVVLGHQLRSPLLVLLVVAAALSFFVGDRTQAVIIGVILIASIGLSFFNEYRAERTAAALHSGLRHHAVVLRDGQFGRRDVIDLVPGDVVQLTLGEAVPADLRLLAVNGLECDESILSGESTAAPKSTDQVTADASMIDLHDIAFMGTIVTAGDGLGVVYATGSHTQFGAIAAGLGKRQPDTAFQVGLRKFSYLLLWVAVTLTVFIVVVNVMLGRPAIDAVLFALAIAVGITPQLLPAVVSTSLAAGARRLAGMKVLVKRLVCIEDLGDIDILFTDKTGTLTDGRINLLGGVDPAGTASSEVVRLGLLACEISAPGAGGNALDAALWEAPDATSLTAGTHQVKVLPFDHHRRATSALIDDGQARRIVVKGAPEQVLQRCVEVPAAAQATLDSLFAGGKRVVAVASKPADGHTTLAYEDESELRLDGFVSFADTPKAAAAPALRELARLGITVKVATGDNPQVAHMLCTQVGMTVTGTVTGAELEQLDPGGYAGAVQVNTIFARVSPEQKAALIRAARDIGQSVGFLGDGVNDALALHSADVGISVDSATDIARDAADVVLLEKDLGILARGVAEGRRIFANTIKYVLMGTSSNFGTMFSAAGASAVLPFLPMLPSQILLNNLLYDGSQLAIPTDRVDEEQLRAPAHWDIGFIRRFMLVFGPISSLFDFATFGLLLGVLHAAPEEFRTGWFVESVATQTLIIFVIRTRRIPFTRSLPSWPLAAATAAAIAIGIGLTLSPFAGQLGFAPLPWQFFVAIAVMTAAYLVLVEITKSAFYRAEEVPAPRGRIRGRHHRIHRRAAPFSQGGS